MDREELKQYFLEKAGINKPGISEEEIDKINAEFHQGLLDFQSKTTQIFYDYIKLEELEGKDCYVVDEEQIKKDFKEYKKLVLKCLKNIPEDYDLKRELIMNGMDYENINDDSFNIYRINRIHNVIYKEIDSEYEKGELDGDEHYKIFVEKSEKYNAPFYDPHKDFVISKLNEFLDEIDNRVKKEEDLKSKYGWYPFFSLGRMYLRIVDDLNMVYDSFDVPKINEKYRLLRKNFINDPYVDKFYLRNETGFIGYLVKDMDLYDAVCVCNKEFNKRGLIEYYLSNLNNIFTKDQNSRYINTIIKKNFFFFPLFIFHLESGLDGKEIKNPSKGRYEEAAKMLYLHVIYVRYIYEDADDKLYKEFMFSIKKYFNYYFEDNGLTYSLFKVLEDFYMDDKEIFLISDLEKEYNEKYSPISQEEFEKIFKNLCDVKLIKKCNHLNFLINDEMGFMTQFDIDGDDILKETLDNREESNEEVINNMLKA